MKKNFYFLVAAFFLISLSAISQQRNCYSNDYLENQMQEDPGLQDRLNQLENFTEERIANSNFERIDGIVYVPVVVHVVWDSSAPEQNISDAQIASQVDVIYKDFRALNDEFADIQANQWPQAADTQIEFYLAQIDPDGNPTNGITRNETTVASWGTSDDIKFSSEGGTDAWDPTRYFNFWVGNIGGGILGYATFPTSAGDPNDGIVMSPEYFGSSDYEAAAGETFFLSAPYDLGRTTTHEIGHYLNLRHIWGDGGCGIDDFVADTPESDGSNFGCATGSTSCGSVDMAENYMDYSDDSCMGLFTQGQIDRMRAIFDPGGPRENLNQSPFAFGIVVDAASQEVDICKPDDAIFNFTYTADASATDPVTFTATDLPTGTVATFSPATVDTDGAAVVMTVTGTALAAVGTTVITIQATDGTDTVPANVTLNIFDDTFDTIILGYPSDGSTGVPPMAEFSWGADDNAAAYEIDVATDSGFTNIVSSGVETEEFFTPMGLATETAYFWRVRAVNDCGEGAYTSASFETGLVECNVTDSTDTPVDVPDAVFFGPPGEVTSTLQVNDVAEITDINVTMTISHTWGSDLSVTLISPDNTEVILTAGNGGNGTQYIDTVFDDDAAQPISSGSGNFTGTFMPQQALSAFNGSSAAGEWSLYVTDSASGDTGTIESWSLEICGVPLPDTDNDLIPDNVDNCPFTANTDQSDVDGDGFGDVCDEDIDGDSILNADDNCPNVANPDQADLDDNGVGEACDIICTIGESMDLPIEILEDQDEPQVYISEIEVTDNFVISDINVTIDIAHTWNGDLRLILVHPDPAQDFIILSEQNGGSSDNYTSTVFDDQADVAIADGDAPYTGSFIPDEALSAFNDLPSAGTWLFVVVDFANGDGGFLNSVTLDICGLRFPNDFDGDGVLNDVDNCVLIANSDQADNDQDGLGDECDDDDDNDGVLDVNDNCQFGPNPDQADNDGDGEGDVCDPDDDNDGVLDEDDNCQFIVNPDQSDVDFDGLGDLCDDVVINDILTPNGDGINDTWVIQSIQLFPGTTVRLYNRGGNELFSSNNYSNDWAGTSNGKQLPAGSYYYVVDQSGTGDRVQDGWIYITY